MLSAGSYLFVICCAAALIASGFWAEYRFRRFTKLPAHFDISGRATRFAPKRLIIWLTPSIFLALLGLMVWLANLPGQPGINGEPNSAICIASALVFAAQLLILWLTLRWARGSSTD